jgi:HEAT repeat protein
LHKHPLFVTEADAVKYLQRALESELPDERREAIDRIARTRHLKHEVVLGALSTIAATDPSPAVRCSAVAALRRSEDPAIAATLVRILDQPSTDLRPTPLPPSADVRLEAMRAAVALAELDLLPEEQQPALRDVAVRLVGQERSRDTRQASAKFLGYCRDRAVLEPLIDALTQRDFGVVYESERSLMRLTGRSFDYDPTSWRGWLEQVDDPFAEAGKLDPVLDAPPKGWWQRSIERTRRTLATFGPKKDDA